MPMDSKPMEIPFLFFLELWRINRANFRKKIGRIEVALWTGSKVKDFKKGSSWHNLSQECNSYTHLKDLFLMSILIPKSFRLVNSGQSYDLSKVQCQSV